MFPKMSTSSPTTVTYDWRKILAAYQAFASRQQSDALATDAMGA